MPDTLNAGSYTSTYAYDTFDRLTTGPAGSYTYGDANHIDAVTSTSSGYSASYDAAGNMQCRYKTTSNNCATSAATMTFDNEGRLTHWQNHVNSPSQQESWAYDPSGQRVYQFSQQNSSSTTRVYVGSLAMYKTVSGTTTHYDTFAFAGQLVAAYDTSLHFELHDQLNSPSIEIGPSGNITVETLYAPYGSSVRYGNPSAFAGYTGDGFTDWSGLDYANARWYDPVVGQFVSADTTMDGLNRYAYVHGNPETLTDPSGHQVCDPSSGQCAPPPSCERTNSCPPRSRKHPPICFSNCTAPKPEPKAPHHHRPFLPGCTVDESRSDCIQTVFNHLELGFYGAFSDLASELGKLVLLVEGIVDLFTAAMAIGSALCTGAVMVCEAVTGVVGLALQAAPAWYAFLALDTNWIANQFSTIASYKNPDQGFMEGERQEIMSRLSLDYVIADTVYQEFANAIDGLEEVAPFLTPLGHEVESDLLTWITTRSIITTEMTITNEGINDGETILNL